MTERQRALLAAASASAPATAAAQARRICTSEDCPMARMLEAMPTLCQLEPPKSAQPSVPPMTQVMLEQYAEVRPYSDKIWGPASWTALEADILSLPDTLDEHEFCLFRVYLALRARYLSCSACAMHFEAALKAMPNDGVHRTRAGLLRWLCAVHNDVNRRKQRAPLPEREILNLLRGKASEFGGVEEEEEEAEHAEEEEPAFGAAPTGFESAEASSSSSSSSLPPSDASSPDPLLPRSPTSTTATSGEADRSLKEARGAAETTQPRRRDETVPVVLLIASVTAAATALGLVLARRWAKAARARRLVVLS